jgi:Holliday junction resolvase RusA-like endonuclease
MSLMASGLELTPILLGAFGRPLLDVVFELAPMPSPRPRFKSRPFPSVYMPKGYEKHKAAVRDLLGRAGLADTVGGVIRGHVVARCAVPASYPRWKRELCERGELWPQLGGKDSGDWDNYAKTIMDACSPKKAKGKRPAQRGVWRDDSGVRAGSVDVLFARPDVHGGRPHWRLILWQLPGRLAGAATTRAGEA